MTKEKSYSFSQLREKMNVSFILNGSTYVSNDKFRINFELIGLEKNEILSAGGAGGAGAGSGGGIIS